MVDGIVAEKAQRRPTSLEGGWRMEIFDSSIDPRGVREWLEVLIKDYRRLPAVRVLKSVDLPALV